jgi:hypothetical protein
MATHASRARIESKCPVFGLSGQLIESAAGARKRMINRSAKIVGRSDFDLFSPAQRPVAK